MHELGLVFEMARVIEESLAGEDVTAVDTVVMEIGEVSSVVPHYFESCFPAARQRPLFRDAKLEMEIIPAVGRCKRCGNCSRERLTAASCKTAYVGRFL